MAERRKFSFLGRLFRRASPSKTEPEPILRVEDPKLPPELEAHRRSCWTPVTRGEGEGHSQFGGLARLRVGEERPACGQCHRPLHLFLQLDSEDLPKEVGSPFGEGLLQVFYCVSTDPFCEVEAEAWAPFGASTLVRVLEGQTEGGRDAEDECNRFPEKFIAGWERRDDLPNSEEAESLGIHLDDDLADELQDAGFPNSGDKLLGWPDWCQGLEYPSCNRCQQRMTYLFQIDSENNVPYMFGDMGVSHVYQCPVHRDVLGIAWACS